MIAQIYTTTQQLALCDSDYEFVDIFADVDVDVTGSLKTVVTSLEVCVLFLTFTSVSILLSDYRE